jgi:hypothetical protein
MSKHAKYFETQGNDAMRFARLPVACPALAIYRTSRACIGIAPACRFAKVLRTLTRQLWMAADKLPQLPQLALGKLGQHKPNKHAMPQVPQVAPSAFNVCQMQRRVWCAGRELNSRHKSGLCNPTVQLNGSFWHLTNTGRSYLAETGMCGGVA